MLAQLFWATNFVFGARLIAEFTPVELTTYRWVGALPLLLVIAWWFERPDWAAAWAEWKLHLLQAMLGMVGYTLLLYAALDTSSSVNAAVISAMSPATITIAAVLLLGERVTRVGVVGIALSIIGVLVVVLAGQDASAGFSGSVGDLLLVGSVLSWTAYVIVSRRLRTPPIAATTVQVALSVVVLLPVLLVVGAPAQPTGEGWFGLAWIIVFPSALAYLLWNIAAATLGPARTGVFLNLLPVFNDDHRPRARRRRDAVAGRGRGDRARRGVPRDEAAAGTGLAAARDRRRGRAGGRAHRADRDHRPRAFAAGAARGIAASSARTT